MVQEDSLLVYLTLEDLICLFVYWTLMKSYNYMGSKHDHRPIIGSRILHSLCGNDGFATICGMIVEVVDRRSLNSRF